MTKKGDKPKPPTKKEIKAYLKHEQHRKDLDRVSGAIEREAKRILGRFLEYTRDHGGELKQVVAGDHRLTIHDVDGLVKWKDEFVRVAGAEAAEALMKAAEKREKLMIEPIVVAKSKKKAA